MKTIHSKKEYFFLTGAVPHGAGVGAMCWPSIVGLVLGGDKIDALQIFFQGSSYR